MKRFRVTLVAGLLLIAPAGAMAADPVQSLGMSPAAARQAIFETFDRGFVTLPSGYVAFWGLDDSHRAALVPPLLAVVRAYVESAEFAARLDTTRAAANGAAAKPAHATPNRLSDELVAERLRQFLALSADVDFSARMVVRNNLTCFADPKLESRSAEWKLCYRAGPKTLAAARACAGDWLETLGVSAER